MQIAQRLPAWFIQSLPVRLARQCVNKNGLERSAAIDLERQLLVDVSVIYKSDARTGIQRVVRSLLLQLLQSPPEGYRVCPVFATRKDGYRYAAQDFLEPRFASHPPQPALPAVQIQNGDLFLGLDLSAHILPRHQAQILYWKRKGVRVHIVVYDLLPLQNPEWFNPGTTRKFRKWVRFLAIYADGALCISNTVKNDLGDWLFLNFRLPVGAICLSTIPLGADIRASAPTFGLAPGSNYILTKLRTATGVLVVGTLEPRKAHKQVLAAFQILKQINNSEIILVFVGKPGWKTSILQDQIKSHQDFCKKIFWFDDASDEMLLNLYAACRGVLVPSLGEGFGLPVIEAALHKKPILARDLPVFRELNLPNITFFTGEGAEVLAQAMSEWVKDLENKNCVLFDQERVSVALKAHQWEKSASTLLQNILD